MSELDNFESLNFEEQAGEPVVAPNTEAKAASSNSEQREKKAKMQAAFQATLEEDPSLKSKLNIWSPDLEVVNTLGWGDRGNLIETVKKSEAPDGKRKVGQTAQIVGYRVKNIGKKPIPMITRPWKREGEAFVSGGEVTVQLKPGQYIDLPRDLMTINMTRPEVSSVLANGKMIPNKAGKKSTQELLEAFYFSFFRGEDGTTKRVNDTTEVKINVGIEKDGKWTVRPEFEATFGFLNNGKPDKKSAPKVQGPTAAQMVSAYVQRLINSKPV